MAGNYLLTNATLVSSAYVGAGNFGTSQGVVIAVPAANGTYPFGLLAISGYNVYNYNGSTSFGGTNTLSVGAGTNVFVITNSGSYTIQVPNQIFLTNGQTTLVYSNPATIANLAQVTNIVTSLANTNSFNLQTVTNVANGVYSNNASSYISLSQLVSSNFLTSVPASTTNRYTLTNDTTWFDPKGAALASTGAVGIASGLIAFRSTNDFTTLSFVTNLVFVTSNGITAGSGISAAMATNISQNIAVGGVVSGANTNQIFSVTGTNSIQSIASSVSATNAISNLNGRGTNTSFNAVNGSSSSYPITFANLGGSSSGSWAFRANTIAWSIAGGPNVGAELTWLGGGNGVLGASNPVGFVTTNISGIGDTIGIEAYQMWTAKLWLNGVLMTTVTTNNPNSFVYQSSNWTNGVIQSNLAAGGLPGYLLATTNVVGMWNSGVSLANGTYTILLAGLYTNTSGNGSDLSFQNPTWFQRTNGVNLYSSSSLAVGSTWNNVIGSTTIPNSSYGYTNNLTGIVFYNFTSPTNLVTGSSTTVAAGSNVTVSAVGSAYTVSVPTQTFLTNGFVGAGITNGFATTSYVNSSDLAVSNGATRVDYYSTTPSNRVTTASAAMGFNTNGMVWINRNGNSNNWLVLITTNR